VDVRANVFRAARKGGSFFWLMMIELMEILRELFKGWKKIH